MGPRYQKVWNQFLEAVNKYRKLGYALVSRDERIIDCTQTFGDLLNRDRSELIGMSISELSFPEDSESTGKKLHSLFAGVGHISTFKRYRGPRNEVLWRQLESQAIVEDNGTRLASVSCIWAVPKTEAEYLDLQESLNRIVKEMEKIGPHQVVNVTNSDMSNRADHGSQINQNINGGMFILTAMAGLVIFMLVALAVFLTINAGVPYRQESQPGAQPREPQESGEPL